jgi:phage shock protein E
VDNMWIVVVVVLAAVFLGSRMIGKKDSSAAHALVAGGAALVDVRTPGEYAAGHIDGAVNIPVDRITSRAGEIGGKDRPVVVYCRSGARSAAAASALQQLGFQKVEDLGAMSNW